MGLSGHRTLNNKRKKLESMNREADTKQLQLAMEKGRTLKKSQSTSMPFHCKAGGIVATTLAIWSLIFALITGLGGFLIGCVGGAIVMITLLVNSIKKHKTYWYG